MSRVHVADRKPSKLATEENALELARQIRELDYIRNFGFKVRMAKTPRNWDEWSTDAKAAWVLREADKLDRLRRLDETYLAQKRREVERDVKKLLHNITAGNSYKRPKCIEEANRRLMCQDAAIEACNELYTDLQDIMDTLPIDKNWMVQIEPLIDRELALLHGWRNGDAATHTIAQGQYVIWHSALYTADAAITSGTTLAASGNDKNLTAVENGGLNALNSKTAYTMGYLVKAMANSTGNEVEFTFATTENRVTIVVTVGGKMCFQIRLLLESAYELTELSNAQTQELQAQEAASSKWQ